ncbi:uncharacterized protein EV154DRAFT_186829 [Mucor mucedo]|uniref:uncharacterized protein n=1 Tax=Mucor mucedo TaxID=29922 RepID=UPI00221E81BB|nr:uncharacterized protein EV154DRAFT_186829 [Mucor mucedo]KAI7892662.1 hypothetical protein EV154DRAFT_186829 [Mucor mucedo]
MEHHFEERRNELYNLFTSFCEGKNVWLGWGCELTKRMCEYGGILTIYFLGVAVDFAQHAPSEITRMLINNDFFFSGLEPLPVNEGYLCLSYDQYRAQMSQVPMPVRFVNVVDDEEDKLLVSPPHPAAPFVAFPLWLRFCLFPPSAPLPRGSAITTAQPSPP